MNLRGFLNATDNLSDNDFDALIRHAVYVRRSRNAAVAYQRQLDVATCGLSTHWGAKEAALPENRHLDAAEFELRLRELDLRGGEGFDRRIREATGRRW